MDEKQRGIFKKVYTREAVIYDNTRYKGNYGKLQLRGIYHAIDTQINISRETRILDVATGTGVASLYMAEIGGQVIGMDLTEAMLRRAKEKAEIKNLHNIEFHAASAFELPYKDNSFDVVTSVKFFHLLPNNLRKNVINEMFRVLKPGGTLFIEFKNGFYGGVLRLLRKKEGHYLWPHHIKKLLKNERIVNICGYYLPGQRRISQNSIIHRVIEIGGHCFFIRNFYDKLYIKCTKSV